MGRLFGTDGVRGSANGELTAELALDLVGRRRPRPRPRPATFERRTGRSPWWAATPALRGVPGGRRRRRSGLRRGRRRPARRAADAGRRLPDRRPGRRPRRDAVGQPQPDARQRHQVLRPRRRQARRRRRGRHRGAAPASRGTGRPAPAWAGWRGTPPPSTTTSTTWSRTLAPRLDGLKVVLDCANGAASRPARAPSRPPAPRWSRSTPSPTGSTSTTAAAPPTWSRCGRRSSSTAPTSASPSTATPTAAWPSTPRATSSTATRSWRSWRWPCATPARLSTTPWWPP